MGTRAKKPEAKKQTKEKKKKSGWTRFYRVVKVLNSRWFTAALAIAWGIAVYGKERK